MENVDVYPDVWKMSRWSPHWQWDSLKHANARYLLCWEDNRMGHEVNIKMNNKCYSCICMIYPGGTHESRLMLLLIVQYSHGHFSTLLSLERKSAFRKDPISDNQSANRPLNSRSWIWIGGRGTDSGMKLWKKNCHVSEHLVGISHQECLCLSVQILHVRGCMHVCVWVCARRHALTHCRVDGYALKQHCLVA